MTHSHKYYRGGQGLRPMTSTLILNGLLPEGMNAISNSPLRRKQMDAPIDNGTFIKPLKQCFMRNPRLMPGTRVMLALLSGWSGHGRAIETTMFRIGKQLGRSRRQIFRYLQDAVEEGYILYSRTKNKLGYITGIKIWINLGAVRHSYDVYIDRKCTEYRRNQGVTLPTHNNLNSNLFNQIDEKIEAALSSFAQRIGYNYPDIHT